MKKRIVLPVLLLLMFISGCVVYSFYPLYTQKDLFPNDLLLGTWIDDDSTIWYFNHSYIGDSIPQNLDRTNYSLTLKMKDDKETGGELFDVKVIKLEGRYFLDFYLKENGNNGLRLSDFHIIPVHTFAKVSVEKDSLSINWFDNDWLKKLIEQNKIRIHHEDNGDIILLTAKPDELQKFVIKYVNSEDAFKDGLKAELKRIE